MQKNFLAKMGEATFPITAPNVGEAWTAALERHGKGVRLFQEVERLSAETLPAPRVSRMTSAEVVELRDRAARALARGGVSIVDGEFVHPRIMDPWPDRHVDPDDDTDTFPLGM